MSTQSLSDFVSKINSFYAKHKRPFPWRYVDDPYLVVVSEIMLQQTQTYRVQPKYETFIKAFPSFHALANASTHDLFLHWQGLGYNRRALYLQQLAQWVVATHNGVLPADPELLLTQKGIGPSTANSICAFAFNKPTVFIETNIRAVFLHDFFYGQENVHDKQIFPLIAVTVDQINPRSWYYALMDYGVYLKATLPNPSKASKHHTKQSTFKGSNRQLRGAIIRFLVTHGPTQKDILANAIQAKYSHASFQAIELIAQKMIQEQLLKNIDNIYFL